MRELFEQIIAAGEAEIQRFKDEGAQEDVFLEFKRKGDPTHGIPDRNDRKNLGRALSGLANLQGGLLVWGVIARKNDEGVDCAMELQPIADIQRFKAEILSALGTIIMPRHDGILVGAITA